MRKSNKYLIKKGVRKKEKRKNNGGTSHETMEVFEEKINVAEGCVWGCGVTSLEL